MKKSTKATRCVRWCWKLFCIVFFCKKNLKRDLIALGLLLFILAVVLGDYLYLREKTHQLELAAAKKQDQPVSEQQAVQNEQLEIPKIQSQTDTSSWTKYQNTWYGFSLKYPGDWLDPAIEKASAGTMWEQKIQFRISQTDEKNPFEGFDVVVYNVSKVKELANTDEFPKLKNAELGAESDCSDIQGHLLETGDYPAEEIYVPANDACYNAALFFSNTRDNYIYIITPKIKDGAGLAGDPAREIASHMPEFFSVAKNWNLIDIQRPKPVPVAPKITAPMPLSFDVVGGRLVCAKKNDKPSKSSQHKGKHMDMECCLDPDEYPNPHCYYPPGKYGKYL